MKIIPLLISCMSIFSLSLLSCSDSNTNSSGAGGGGLGSSGPPVNDWHPTQRYVMVTFDDGLPIQSLVQVAPLLFSGCDMSTDVGLEGSTSNIAACVEKPRRINNDQSQVRMTYFATAGFSGNFANLDYWASVGNEIANHTTTHVNGWGGQSAVSGPCAPPSADCPKAYTQSRWKNELLDMQWILEYWTDITQYQSPTGFRAPQLFLNYTVFDALDEYLTDLDLPNKVLPPGVTNNPFYDSNLRYDPNTKPLLAPRLLSQENFCDGTNLVSGLTPLTSPYNDCTQLIPAKSEFANEIWELPMPLVGEFLMELPQDLSTLNTFLDKQETSSGTYIPLLISLHTSEIQKHPSFQEWMQSAIDDHDVNFVTVGEVINMYANQNEDVPKPLGYTISEACLNGAVLTWSPSKCSSKWADSTPDGSGVASTDPYCNLNCDETNYGTGCFSHIGSPDGSGGFQTCREGCSVFPPNSTPSTYSPGAYPWLGNSAGNLQLRSGTARNSCDFFPPTTSSGMP